jgi:Fe-coproporphyrin III synthase
MQEGAVARNRKLLMKKWGYWAWYGMQHFLLRKERPLLFLLIINDRCNLNCFYCESKNSGRYDLSFEEAQKLISQARTRGFRHLIISGGEPLLWQDNDKRLIDIVELSYGLGYFDVSVFTNATSPLRVRASRYFVSVEGTKERHDRLRQGTFDEVISNARQADAPVTASITISKHNASELRQAIEGLVQLKVFYGISLNFLTHAPAIVTEQGVSQNEKNNILDMLWELRCSGYPIMLSRSAYKGLRNDCWKRPIRQTELGCKEGVFTCCRDINNPEICKNCGYGACVEISQALAGKPSALWDLARQSF